MRYIQRDREGKVIGHYANEQPYATELVSDDHPDILAWRAGRAEAKDERLVKAELREALLDEMLADYKTRKGV